MARGWTGGQFSLLRAALALLALDQTASWAAPALTSGSAWWLAAVPAIGACIAFGAGRATRVSGLLAAACAVPALTTGALGFALLTAATATLAPAAPYGSLDARGRVDPGGSWHMPRRLAWLGTGALAIGLLFAAADALLPWGDRAVTPRVVVVLLSAGLLPFPRTRALGWALAGVAMLIGGTARSQPALLAAWLLAVEPRWLPPRDADEPARLFYDGSCGLCHGSVRMLLAEEPATADRAGLRFAPLQGASFEAEVPAAVRDSLPDSLVLIGPDGRVESRSRAVIRLGRRLGGAWRALVGLLAWLPRPLADGGYDLVARVRRSLTGTPDAACPILPDRLRARFDP